MKLRIILFACVAAAASLLCACEANASETLPSDGVHIHTFGEWQETPATCTEKGVIERACSGCGAVQRKETDALGHDYREVSRTDPTCEKAGSALLQCSHCGGTKTEPLPSSGHRWEEHVERQATCTQTGVLKLSCSLCGGTKTEEIPLSEHSWGQVQIVEEPTCTRPGVQSAVCTVCGARESEQPVPEKGHSFGEWTRKEPTCEDDGEEKRSCTVCGSEETKVLPATGHRYDDRFTVDVEPTADHGGVKSRHCLNPGCPSRTETTPIEPLKTETEYTVSVRDSTGGRFTGGFTPKVEIYDEEGALLREQDACDIALSLPTATYRVKVSGVPQGYSVPREYYELSPALPSLEIRVPAHIIMQKPDPTLKYTIGSVLYDMEVQVIELNEEDDRKISLHELFSQYKAVLINMYFTTCSACVSEMPAFVQAYNTRTADGALYGEEVACVMLDAEPYISGQATEDRLRNFKRQTNYYLRQYAAATDIPMILIHDAWLRAYFARAISGGYYPTSILIDCEGVILKTATGTMSSGGFLSWMQQGIDRYHAIRAWRESEGLSEPEEREEAFLSLRYDLYPAGQKRREL